MNDELKPDIEKKAATPSSSFLGGLLRWVGRQRFWMEMALLLFLLLAIYFWKNILVTVHSGELGVYFKRFSGTVLEQPPLAEGLHVILPFNKIYIYNIRVQQYTQEYHVLSRDGLKISITISIRYHPRRDKQLNILHQQLGPDYLHTVIIPEIEAALRTIIGKYEPAELYQAEYGLLESAISESLLQLTESYVYLDDLLITKIELPPMVQEAIEEKIREQHNAEKYKYLLIQAEEEAKRKVILATGIRDFQDIVREGISTALLQWRGIEATLELARSPNAKIIIIGGHDGLPLILNTGDMSSSPGTTNSIPSASSLLPATAVIPGGTSVLQSSSMFGAEFGDLGNGFNRLGSTTSQ